MSENGRAKAIDIAVGQIEKQFGKGAIMRLGSREVVDVPAISTGSISLDARAGSRRPAAGQSGRDLRTGVLR